MAGPASVARLRHPRHRSRAWRTGCVSRPALTGGRFEIAKKFDLNEFLKGSLGLFKGQEDFEVVMDLDAFAADDVEFCFNGKLYVVDMLCKASVKAY